jgi:hypothetical protein
LWIDCEGCLCLPYLAFFQELYPFPDLQADALYAVDKSYLIQNASVTAMSEFTIVWDGKSTCALRITNMVASPNAVKRRGRNVSRRNTPTPDEPSHVRIDSLQLSLRSRSEMYMPGTGQISRVRTSALGSVRHGRTNPRGKGLDIDATQTLLGLSDRARANQTLFNESQSVYLHVSDEHHSQYTYSPCTFAP